MNIKQSLEKNFVSTMENIAKNKTLKFDLIKKLFYLIQHMENIYDASLKIFSENIKGKEKAEIDLECQNFEATDLEIEDYKVDIDLFENSNVTLQELLIIRNIIK